MKKLFVDGSYVGNTGYNQHTRVFFRHLSKHSKINEIKKGTPKSPFFLLNHYRLSNCWTELWVSK